MSNIEEASFSKNKKRRKRTTKQKPQPYVSSFQSECELFSYNLKTKPQKTVKKLLIKIGLYTWSIAVFLSILSLIGFPITSLFDSSEESLTENSHSRVLRSSDVDNTKDFWGSISNNLFVLSELTSEQEESSTDVQTIDEPSDPDDEEAIEIPKQILPSTPKQGNKLNRKLEKELACQEEDCNTACNKKIKAKCSRSASCRRDREKLCKRRCRKQRCEDRCKDEPKFGYVEREQRMEKCKDECSGPTAVHNKCIKKCHSQFKPCKSRCHEIAGKYSCDRVEEVPSIVEEVTSMFDDPEVI